MLKHKRLMDDNVRHFLKNLVDLYSLTSENEDTLDHKIRSIPKEEILGFAAIKIKYKDGLEVLAECRSSIDVTDMLCSHLAIQNGDSAEDLIDELDEAIASYYIDEFVDELSAIAAEERHEEMFDAGYRLSQDRENGEYNYVRN